MVKRHEVERVANIESCQGAEHGHFGQAAPFPGGR